MLVTMKACHKIAMSDDVKLEWDYRASNWSKEWYASMVRKSKVRWVTPADCASIEVGIDEHAGGNFALKKIFAS